MDRIVAKLMSCLKKTLHIVYAKYPTSTRSDWRRQTDVSLELIEGTHKNNNARSSVIHFSFNKAATQYVKSILVMCATDLGMTHVGLNEYAFNAKFPYLDHLSADEMKLYQHIFKKKGYLYSVFGGMIENIQELEDYKVVLVVRDPRDILVSNYYSMAFSHTEPNKDSSKYFDFMKKRNMARTTNIDEYVLNECCNLKDIFDRYSDLLLHQYKHVYITKYEDMVADFTMWLDGLLAYCDMQISESLRANIIKKNRLLVPTSEKMNKHMRNGKPGDYQNKLQRYTIQHLDKTFLNYLKVFGYME